MFLESVLLSGCGLLLLYSTAGVCGGWGAGLRAKGAPRLGFYVLCIVRFFTKPLIFYDKLVPGVWKQAVLAQPRLGGAPALAGAI